MGLFGSILKSLVPRRRKRKKSRKGAARAGGGFRPTGGGGVTVLIADLFGAGGAEIADRLAGMVGQEAAVSVLRLKQSVRQNLRLGMLERLMTAAAEGEAMLRAEKANLLIWGEMEDMGSMARLRFLVSAETDNNLAIFGLADSLDLPVPLPDGTGDIVRAVVAAAALPLTAGSRQDLLERLRKHLALADAGVATLPADMQPDNRSALLCCLGVAHGTAFQFGDKKSLARALASFEAAAALTSAADWPVAWALVQTHWGSVLEADAKARKDPAAMQAASERYQAVTESLGRDEHGYDWAMAQVRRGLSLYKLASMDGARMVAHLKGAITAFEEALTVYDRNLMPDRWADVMSHYGVVQMALGGHGASNAMLQQSVTTFRKVMEIRKRDTAPLLWAQTANNLGAACFALGKRNRDEHLLEEAAQNFEHAMLIFRDTSGHKKRAAVIENNLQRVRHMLEDAMA